MPTVPPPLPPQPPQPPALPPSPAPVLTVTHPPVELARLPIGSLLEALVLNQPGKDTFVLQTALGQLSVLSTVALPKEANLVLQILSLSPQAQLQINELNGAAPAFGQTAALKAGIPTRPAASAGNPVLAADRPSTASQPAILPSLLNGSVVRAVSVRPLAAPTGTVNPATLAPGAAAAAPLQPGTTPPSIAALKPPSFAPTAATRAATRAATGAASSTPPATAVVATRPALGVAPSGTQLSFKITRIDPPSAAANTALPASSTPLATALAGGKVLRGVITGTTASGHPVVQTPSGVFSLNAQSTAPRGSTLTLQVIEPPKFIPPVAATSVHPGQESAGIFADRRWPPLEQAVQVLHDVNPAASRHFIAATLPRPDGQLTSGLIFFLTALRGGDLRSWFGDANMAVLGKSRPGLANQLANDFNMLARVAEEPVGADWRVAMIPINTGNQIEQIRMLFRRHDNDEDENAGGDTGTRFILDVNLTRLGRLQLDGLVRDQGKKLDLILRSDDVLNDTNRNDIRRVFSQAAELTGVQGSVSFQASPPDFIEIPDPLAGPLADHNVGLIV